jgi:hypothetical protein
LPSKSKHSRGKRRHGKKKSKFRQVRPVTGIPQETSGNVAQASTPVAAAPVVKAPVPKKASASAALPLHYEFISGDLKRIGILTGVIVVLLIVAYYIFA